MTVEYSEFKCFSIMRSLCTFVFNHKDIGNDIRFAARCQYLAVFLECFGSYSEFRSRIPLKAERLAGRFISNT